MINPKLPKIWYGGDYNPDQWPEEVWLEDMRLMKLCGADVATVPVFSWANLQPAEDVYTFDWLDRVMDLLADHGRFACLATPTAAQPAWMSHRYPEVLPVDGMGIRRRHGNRVNFCPTSPVYRQMCMELVRRMAERYAEHPALLIWHISNEYGPRCYCDLCAEAFRNWLKARYGSLDELNRRWYTSFWGHRYTAWEQVEPPYHNGESSIQGLCLDYDRFMSDSVLECYRNEYDTIRDITPEVPITTNLMGTFKPLDYFKWARHMDVVAWDNYPSMREDMGNVALRHDLMRGLKDGQPFMLMEQTPSQQNWQAYNSLKPPGVMRLWSYQAVAHGADTVMFFQWRRSRGCCEKLHGAFVEHVGHEHTRVFRECTALGAELQKLGDTLLDSRIEARVALMFDWENWWAVDYRSGPSKDLNYIAQVEKYYKALWRRNIPVDLVPCDADLSRYDIVLAPILYMVKPGVAESLRDFVAGGGTFVTTFFSGLADENDLMTLKGYPGELRELMGVWAEEIDALFPDQRNSIVLQKPLGSLAGAYDCGLLCDLIHAESADVLATYGDNWYAGRPCLTVNAWGEGRAYYVATDPSDEFLEGFLASLCEDKGIRPVLKTPPGVEATLRQKGGKRFLFLLNHNPEPATVVVEPGGVDLLTDARVSGPMRIPAHGVMIVAQGT